jgi:RNA polymerase sigma-70 factor (ECF subfamily)
MLRPLALARTAKARNQVATWLPSERFRLGRCFFIMVSVVVALARPLHEEAATRARHAEALAPRRRFENMLDRHESRLRRLAFGMLGDPHRVDDVLQDALIRAYLKLPTTFENEHAEAAWLYRIVHRTCLNEIRGRRRRREEELADVHASTHGVDARSLVLAEALGTLSVDARATVLLVDVAGFDYESAASILGIRRGTVASRLNAARSALREALDA